MREPQRRRVERARRRRRSPARWALGAIALIVLTAAVVGFAFAGSASDLPSGVRIAGVDVGGMSAADARRTLERRSARLSKVPVVFHVASKRFRIAPSTLGVEVDWGAAVASAQRSGEGFGPLRGFRRLGMRFFGSTVTPSTRVYDAALAYELDVLSGHVNRKPRNAQIVLHGLRPAVVPGQVGRGLARGEAEDAIVQALASFSRSGVWLPMKTERPRVGALALRPALAQARVALSAPVTLTLGGDRYRLSQWQLARMIDLPDRGARRLYVRGPYAKHYFEVLAKKVDREPVDATFTVDGGNVSVVPSHEGFSLDARATAAAVLRAATIRGPRVAQIAVERTAAKRTTAQARRMGIVGIVSSYETIYGGDANRVHNVGLVARLVDNHLIAPGAEFSFNGTTGERSADKGFLEAPVIINGELQTGIGGGVCQVSTTTFNAAYEAGLPITARTNHALYISHYPQGRDATVDYPGVDLKFVNDTGHWLLLRTFVGSSSLVVNLYGTPTHRRVETETAPLVTIGSAPMNRVLDADLEKGKTEIESYGVPPRSTSVHRKVYDASGKLIREDSFYSSYRGETGTILVGTKPKPKPKPEPKPANVKAPANPFLPF